MYVVYHKKSPYSAWKRFKKFIICKWNSLLIRLFSLYPVDRPSAFSLAIVERAYENKNRGGFHWPAIKAQGGGGEEGENRSDGLWEQLKLAPSRKSK